MNRFYTTFLAFVTALVALLYRAIRHLLSNFIKWIGSVRWRPSALLESVLSIARFVVANKKVSIASVVGFVALLILSTTATTECSHSGGGSSSPSKSKQHKPSPKSINTLISNSMSETEQTKAFDRDIEAFMRRWELTGGTFAIMRNDSLLYAKGYGYADREREIKCDASNTFRIASASKLLTAAAIMKLVEDKKLTLNQHIFGEKGILCDSTFMDLKDRNLRLITVEHLLRHTSGLSTPISDPAFANYSVAKSLGKELPLDIDDMVKYASLQRVKARPGGLYDYSNLGYIILGKVIEVASGMGYEEYLQRKILEPAGCYDIYIGKNFSKDRGENEVKYYEVKEAELFPAYDGSGRQTLKSDGGNNVTLLSSAGGFVASGAELLRFVAAINGSGTKRDILSKESIRLMTYDSSDRSKKPMGWATVRGSEWLRSGSMAGTCALIKKQKDGYTWVFITNSSAWIAYHLANHISSNISRSVSRVKQWPKQDLFTLTE